MAGVMAPLRHPALCRCGRRELHKACAAVQKRLRIAGIQGHFTSDRGGGPMPTNEMSWLPCGGRPTAFPPQPVAMATQDCPPPV